MSGVNNEPICFLEPFQKASAPADGSSARYYNPVTNEERWLPLDGRNSPRRRNNLLRSANHLVSRLGIPSNFTHSGQISTDAVNGIDAFVGNCCISKATHGAFGLNFSFGPQNAAWSDAFKQFCKAVHTADSALVEANEPLPPDKRAQKADGAESGSKVETSQPLLNGPHPPAAADFSSVAVGDSKEWIAPSVRREAQYSVSGRLIPLSPGYRQRNSDRLRARFSTARVEHHLNYGHTDARRPPRKKALGQGIGLIAPYATYGAADGRRPLWRWRDAAEMERPTVGMGLKPAEMKLPLALANLEADPFESAEGRAVLQLLCQFLQTNSVAAVFDWLLKAPEYERGLALRLVRRVFALPAGDGQSDLTEWNREPLPQPAESEPRAARTASERSAHRTPRVHRYVEYTSPERVRAPTPRPASSLSLSSISFDQCTQVGTRDWVRAQDPRARSALGSVLSDPVGGGARPNAPGEQRLHSLPELPDTLVRRPGAPTVERERPHTSRGYGEPLQLHRLKSTASEILKIPDVRAAPSDHSAPIGGDGLTLLKKAARTTQPLIPGPQQHASRPPLPRIAEERADEQQQLERLPLAASAVPVVQLESGRENASSLELAFADTARSGRSSSRLKPRSVSVATQT